MKTLLAKAKIGLLLCLLSLTLTAAGQQWTQTTSLPDGYAGQSLVYWNGFLYQAGGFSEANGILDGANVFYAQVFTNGTIGTWNVATPLPEPVEYHAGAAANGFLYILGGYHYNPELTFFVTNLVYYAKINPDGSVGAWQMATPMPNPLFFLSAAVWNGRIYVAGGADQSNYDSVGYNTVWSAQIQTNGNLSPWITQPSLPVPTNSDWSGIYTHSSVANGFLYVLGGEDLAVATEVLNTVYYSKINADGTLAGWNQTTPLPQPLSSLGSVAAGGRVFAMDGFDGLIYTKVFYSAVVAGDGSLATWSSGPQPRSSIGMVQFGMAASDSYIFVAGGTDEQSAFNTVYSLALPSPPAKSILSLQHSKTNNTAQLNLTSTTNTGFGLLASTNLTTWTNIGWGFTGTNGSLLLQDTNAAQFPRRFYRAYWPLP